MPDPETIASLVTSVRGDLQGVRIVVTAGPTREAIDPVRFLSNRSSGKMGYAIAGAARARGAEVTLVTGPVAIDPPPGVTVIPVVSASEMFEATVASAGTADVVVGAAAVADYEAVDVSPEKLRRNEAGEVVLRFRPTRDIIAAVGALTNRPFVVAFAAETNDLAASAREKLQRKNADMIVANDVSDPTIGFDVNENSVTLIFAGGGETLVERASKRVIADRILDEVVARRARGETEPALS